MIEDVTTGTIALKVGSRGSAMKQIDLPLAARTREVHQTPPDVVREVIHHDSSEAVSDGRSR